MMVVDVRQLVYLHDGDKYVAQVKLTFGMNVAGVSYDVWLAFNTSLAGA